MRAKTINEGGAFKSRKHYLLGTTLAHADEDKFEDVVYDIWPDITGDIFSKSVVKIANRVPEDEIDGYLARLNEQQNISKSEKIKYMNKWYYVNSEDLYDPKILKLFLYKDKDLTQQVDIRGGTLMVKKSDIEETLREWGGAGFSMGSSIYPTRRGGQTNRGGFGSASNLGGGNGMYTYEIKPLNRLLQPKPTDFEVEETIHDGNYIEGEELNKKDGKLHRGTIIKTEKTEGDDVMYYVILCDETSTQMKIDPTSAVLLSGESYFEDPDQEGGIAHDAPDLLRAGQMGENKNYNMRAKTVNESMTKPVKTTVDEFMTWYAATPEWDKDWQTSNVMEVNGVHAQEDGQDGRTHLAKLSDLRANPITISQSRFRPGDWDLSFELNGDEYSLQSAVQAFSDEDDF